MSILTFLIIDSVSCILSGSIGYYIAHRGLTGVRSDLSDIGSDVKAISAKIKTIKK